MTSAASAYSPRRKHLNDAIEFGHDIEREVAPAGLVGVERVLVELQAFLADTAENHRAQTARTDRQRLIPIRSGLAIPEPQAGSGVVTARQGAAPAAARNDLRETRVGITQNCISTSIAI